MFERLRRNMVEIRQVTNGMDDGERQACPSAQFMQANSIVQRNVLVKSSFFQLGDDVFAHRKKHQAKRKRHCLCASTSNCNAKAHDFS